MSLKAVFDVDMERVSSRLLALDAVRYAFDATGDFFAYIDEGKAPPALLSAYRGLCEFGYANGLIEAARGCPRP